MTPKKSPAKKPARRALAKPKAPARRVAKRTPEERKSHAIELILIAIASGWTITRFALHSHVSKGTLLRWMAEDTVVDRFIKAMQAKALALPDEASEIVNRMINGRSVTRMVDGKPVTTWEFLDPKAGRAALSHYEFRMMREIKAYQARSHVAVTTDTGAMTDAQVDAKFEELMDRHRKAREVDGNVSPAAEDEKAGHT